ncbi:hypothetical protein KUTeg_017837 [Tegillarca granosa]|uniref:Splicing factor 4 n=1 Tax=Tegillarca granosa TaxID=220873 RepID=A0ABQ9EG32_TEGGR|nr:hypothetical protein KUTeg_017837 [Tegillarca granosa]
MSWQQNNKSSTSSATGYVNTSYKDKMQQMSNQERLIEEKKKQIQEKLKAAQQKQSEGVNPPPLKFGIGKRPGFAALGKKPKADLSKDKKTTPIHTGFLANDGNFLERFKQLQGAKVGATKPSLSLSSTAADSKSSSQMKSESKSPENEKSNLSKDTTPQHKLVSTQQNFNFKSEEEPCPVVSNVTTSSVSNTSGPYNVMPSSDRTSFPKLTVPHTDGFHRPPFSTQISSGSESPVSPSVQSDLQTGGMQLVQRYPPPPPLQHNPMQSYPQQNQFYPSNPGIQGQTVVPHQGGPNQFAPNIPQIQQVGPPFNSPQNQDMVPHGQMFPHQQAGPPGFPQQSSHFGDPQMQNHQPKPPPPPLMSLNTRPGSFGPGVPPGPPPGPPPGTMQIRGPIPGPPQQQVGQFGQPPGPPQQQGPFGQHPGPAPPTPQGPYGQPPVSHQQSGPFGQPPGPPQQPGPFCQPQGPPQQVPFNPAPRPPPPNVPPNMPMIESQTQFEYNDYGNPITRNVPDGDDGYRGLHPAESQNYEDKEDGNKFEYDDYGNPIKSSTGRHYPQVKQEESDSDYDPAMPTEAESPVKPCPPNIKFEPEDPTNLQIKKEPILEKSKILTSGISKLKRPLSSEGLSTSPSKFKMSEVFDIPKEEVKRERGDYRTDRLLLVSPPDDPETQQVIETLASFIAKGGPHLEEKAMNENKDNPAFWFLYDQSSHAYKYFRYMVSELTKREANQDGNEADIEEHTDDKPSRNKKKRKSRWGPEEQEQPPSIPVIAPVIPPVIPNTQLGGAMPPVPHPMPVAQSHPPTVTLQDFARKMVGSDTLNEDQIRQIQEQKELNMMYELILAQKKAKEAALMSELPGIKSKAKYEYDSDEETEEWADQLTEMNRGKHFIGDFLPPDELERFMETYKALKEGREPDLSDYKDFKITCENLGYQMLQKLGWKEGEGLGSEGQGNQSVEGRGLGIDRPSGLNKEDDEYDAFRKRMMLAYRFRPNPLNNPRRPYY